MDKALFCKQSVALRDCGKRLVKLYCATEARRFAYVQTCKCRICPDCLRRQGRKYRRTFTRMIGAWKRQPGQALMMLTLTFRSTGEPVKGSDIRRGFREVRKLIKTFYPKSQGCGAVAVAEIGAKWNLHVHVIVAGGYVSQRALSARWLQITGNSYIVDVRAVRGVKRSVSYVLKYLTKLAESDSVDRCVQTLIALKGSRRVHTFGIWYNRLKEFAEPKQRFHCPFCGDRLSFDGRADQWAGEARLFWWVHRLRDPSKITDALWSMLSSTVGHVKSLPDWALPPEWRDGFYFALDN